ncbi:MAG: undecaprenyldiphospho-muramoylpentapeptide beta-N-acetylglucosaminyltransferase [Bacillota bacterium]
MRTLIAGGGTGGHVNPALAIARALVEQDPKGEILYVGTREGLEADLVPRAGLAFATIDVRGILRKSAAERVTGVAKAAGACLQAARIIQRFRPDVVVGTGGYVCGPVVLMGAVSGLPTLIQEQNVFPGLTNRLLAPFVSRIAVPFDDARRYFATPGKVVVTGNPIRSEILDRKRPEALAAMGLDPERRTLLVFGGSRGAETINRAMIEALPKLLTRGDLQVILATGTTHHQATVEAMTRSGFDPAAQRNLVLVPYLYNQDAALACADLAVTRAGGITVAELTAMGIPAILVPSPNVTHNHQEYNAQALASRGAAIIIPDAALTGEAVAGQILALFDDPSRLAAMAKAAREMGRPSAAAEIGREIKSIDRTRRRPSPSR